MYKIFLPCVAREQNFTERKQVQEKVFHLKFNQSFKYLFVVQ